MASETEALLKNEAADSEPIYLNIEYGSSNYVIAKNFGKKSILFLQGRLLKELLITAFSALSKKNPLTFSQINPRFFYVSAVQAF